MSDSAQANMFSDLCLMSTFILLDSFQMASLHFITLLCLAAAMTSADDECCTKCPSGWVMFGNRCFMLYYSEVKWHEAETECIKQGGNLVSYRNGEEVKFVLDYMNRVAGKDFQTWTGGYDAVENGVWLWSDGSHFSYTPWASSEPNNNNKKNQHCVELHTSGHFNTQTCTDKKGFVCSKTL
ncbi:hypothetical protein LDENG_00286950 [Lucifuga dentata]|nr:hypothetical protein LDENG_00286950 [Lucifuga dentata]